jgi:hypothetical protein
MNNWLYDQLSLPSQKHNEPSCCTIAARWLAIPGALRINTVYRSLYLMPNANASGRVCGGVSLAGVRYPAAVPDMST